MVTKTVQVKQTVVTIVEVIYAGADVFGTQKVSAVIQAEYVILSSTNDAFQLASRIEAGVILHIV